MDYRILAASSMTKSISVMAQGSYHEMRAMMRLYRQAYCTAHREFGDYNPEITRLDRDETGCPTSMTVLFKESGLMWVYMILPV